MKLSVRIVVLSCVTVLCTTLLCGMVMLQMAANSLRDEAEFASYKRFNELLTEINTSKPDESSFEGLQAWLTYFMKTRKNDENRVDDYNVCFYGSSASNTEVIEIYNHTKLTFEELNALDYENEFYDILSAHIKDDGKSYMVCFYLMEDTIWLYRIEDLSAVDVRVQQLGLCMLGIMAALLLVSMFFLTLLLKHTLKPLQELKATTKRLADGDYTQRVKIHRMDEIGEVEASFNKMAEAVEESTHKLELSEKRKTLFMGNLTHELKTPMTAISGYAQTLLSVKLSKEDEREALYYIYEECGRLERLSKKMMKLLELEQETDISCEMVPAKKLFYAAEKACTVLLKSKDIQLLWEEHGEAYPMDMDLMTDVMINLIDNAVKASEAGGKIILKADTNTIEVQDFGRGIPEEEKEKILEPFYMIDKSRSRKNGGAGLGLALTATILKQQHVTLNIKSTPGEGTRMILQFA